MKNKFLSAHLVVEVACVLVTVSMYGAEQPPAPTGEAGQAQLLLATGAPATWTVTGAGSTDHPASVWITDHFSGALIIRHPSYYNTDHPS